MNLPIRIALFGIIASVGVHIYADNPISSYHYLADPAATSDGETFYILTDSDDPAGSNGYTIKSLYGFSSKDMKTGQIMVLSSKRNVNMIISMIFGHLVLILPQMVPFTLSIQMVVELASV